MFPDDLGALRGMQELTTKPDGLIGLLTDLTEYARVLGALHNPLGGTLCRVSISEIQAALQEA